MLYERAALSQKPEELAQMELADFRAKGQVGPALILKAWRSVAEQKCGRMVL